MNVDESLTVLEYNIFFGELNTDIDEDVMERVDMVCDHIKELDATVVCLQEVIPSRYQRIIRRLSDTYPYRYPTAITQSYDTAIFSKQRITKKTKISYSITSMGRSIMFVTIESPFDRDRADQIQEIAIATSHLESEFGDKFSDMNAKLVQYAEADDILNQLCESCKVEDLIFCADFNSHNKLSNTTLYKALKYDPKYDDNKNTVWKDTWIERGSDPQSEYTFDSRCNPIMLAMHANKDNPPRYVSRLDRIFHKSNLFVHDFKMGLSNKLLSDHYPILATFKTTPPPDGIEYIDYDPSNDDNDVIRVRRNRPLSTKLKRISLFNM